MLTDVLWVMVNNSLKEVFMEKEKKKKTINVLTTFSISYKNCVKIFLKWIINHIALRALVSMIQFLKL